MQLPKLRSTPTLTTDVFATPVISPLADDVDFIRETAILSALQARDVRRRQELDRLALEAEFSTKGVGSKDGPRDTMLRTRLTKLQAMPDYFSGPNTDPAPTSIPSPALARGLEMLKGSVVKPEMSRAERLERLHGDGLVLTDAIRFQDGVVDELRAAKSYEACLALKNRHDDVMLALYRAAQAMATLTDVERDFRTAVIVAGFEIRPDIIGPPAITAPLFLGSEQQHDSQISTWRRHLQQRGIIS